MLHHKRGLTEIAQHERWTYEDAPCITNGTLTKVTHVGIKCLGTRDRQNDGGQQNECVQSVMDNVIPYIHDRKQFGQSIGEFQLIQGKVADMYTVLQAARSFAYTVAKNLDMLGVEHVRQVRKDCASVILWTAEKATWMAGEGVQIFGGNGYINEYPLGRLWRDAKLYEIGAGTSEIRRMLIGRELFAETL